MQTNSTNSMTGFGKAERVMGHEKVVVELRALNSKQLDMTLKLPSHVRELEMEMRKILTEELHRGKIEISVSIEGGMDRKAVVNENLATEYFNQLKGLSQKLGLDQSQGDILGLIMKMPDVLQTQRNELSDSQASGILELVKEACDKLSQFRKDEGLSLEADLSAYIGGIRTMQKEIAPYIETRIDRIRDRVQKNMEQQMEGKDYDASRFEQELVYYIEKYDVSEEMTRLKAHLDYFEETMKQAGATGKKLGFIAQEIGREVNTLGAKSYDSDMQKMVVQMKDNLEKIKEQTLNVL